MFKFISLTLFSLALLSCRQSIEVDKSELNQIYFDILSADSLTGKYYLIDSIEKKEVKKIKQSGTTYFIADCDITKKGIWTESIHDSLVIISKDRLHSITKGDQIKLIPAYYSFSLPYFRKDKQSFIIYYNHYCGSLCAEYSLRLYKLINSKWTFIKSFYSWVS